MTLDGGRKERRAAEARRDQIRTAVSPVLQSATTTVPYRCTRCLLTVQSRRFDLARGAYPLPEGWEYSFSLLQGKSDALHCAGCVAEIAGGSPREL